MPCPSAAHSRRTQPQNPGAATIGDAGCSGSGGIERCPWAWKPSVAARPVRMRARYQPAAEA